MTFQRGCNCLRTKSREQATTLQIDAIQQLHLDHQHRGTHLGDDRATQLAGSKAAATAKTREALEMASTEDSGK